MNIRFIPAILLALSMTLMAACGGTVCDKAADITEDDCGIELEEGDGDGEEEAECEGDAEAFAQCAVDNPSDYCAFLDDPLNAEDNAYADCVADVSG